jgi:putative oxidoreductase
MYRGIFSTSGSISALFLRLGLGIVFFVHGSQKALGWFGGKGFTSTMQSFQQNMHFPAILAFLVIFTEFAGSIALIIGFLTRVSAFGIFVLMLGAIFLVHAPNGFFMNWSGIQKGEGIEYHLLVIAMALALVISGGGRFSLDRLLSGY